MTQLMLTAIFKGLVVCALFTAFIAGLCVLAS